MLPRCLCQGAQIHVLLVFDDLSPLALAYDRLSLSPRYFCFDFLFLLDHSHLTASHYFGISSFSFFLLYATILPYFFLKAFTNLLDCGSLPPCIQPPSHRIKPVLSRHRTL